MPRIRNWKDLIFLKPNQDELYPYLEPLFKGTADWTLIETHWQDMIRVALSIRAGKVLPSTLLRKLGVKDGFIEKGFNFPRLELVWIFRAVWICWAVHFGS
jgi:TnpA family transposase